MLHSNTPAGTPQSPQSTHWPDLPYDAWKDTLATLHMWAQIVGKLRLVQMPWINHSWHTTYTVTARGLTTSAIPYRGRTFQVDFDFIDHRLLVQVSDGTQCTMSLRPQSVADFYRELFANLHGLGIDLKIYPKPNEVSEAIPFDQDHVHASYDADSVNRCWRALLQGARVLTQFRARFIGKCSPVHFFWGSFDLAVTRFSGRPAPPHPGGVPNIPEWVVREAYSHEVSSCGFWPGGAAMPEPVFYAYAYPEPDGFATARVRSPAARYDMTMREFVLPYDAVRQADDPDAMLLEFLQDTYEAAAVHGKWDRAALERTEPFGKRRT
jgi:hypothetical protein